MHKGNQIHVVGAREYYNHLWYLVWGCSKIVY